MIKRMIAVMTVGLGLTAALALPALAQETKSKPSGLSKNSKEPINIEADGLEVFDKEGKAVYTVNVIVTQGDTVMETKKMLIFYVHNEQPQAAPPLCDACTSINRVEA